LDGEQSTIAANAAKRIERWSLHSESGALGCEIASEIANARYHKECYVRFCDKTKVERAEKRIIKKKAVVVDASTEEGASTPVAIRPAPVPVRISPRTLISDSEGTARRNKHVLPEKCIICKRREMYKLDKVCKHDCQGFIACKPL
jgi:hypothetical protein